MSKNSDKTYMIRDENQMRDTKRKKDLLKDIFATDPIPLTLDRVTVNYKGFPQPN